MSPSTTINAKEPCRHHHHHRGLVCMHGEQGTLSNDALLAIVSITLVHSLSPATLRASLIILTTMVPVHRHYSSHPPLSRHHPIPPLSK
ncbi:hypothetical protein ARMGADRAFT_122517 [Armillaria gallica]|uniref:Uncharacterized protein n=1 Tax=Armillaria gallica TaxID=47427 RepID=A0A2H3DW82_ARMGA|nr:hypothetical protein ARMGADRAFT_122517 [Armillaria gallica]